MDNIKMFYKFNIIMEKFQLNEDEVLTTFVAEEAQRRNLIL